MRNKKWYLSNVKFSSNMIGNSSDETDFLHKLLLTNINSSANMKLSKNNQLSINKKVIIK